MGIMILLILISLSIITIAYFIKAIIQIKNHQYKSFDNAIFRFQMLMALVLVCIYSWLLVFGIV